MAKTRRKLVPGLITMDRLPLPNGTEILLHLIDGKGREKTYYYRFIGLIDEGNPDACIAVLDGNINVNWPLKAIGIMPYGNGKYAESYCTVRDEELGLKYCGE